jgi:aspartyl-tRNA(Asn)/glutamyl-tRNA(Gln) amidotransferase subunit C
MFMSLNKETIKQVAHLARIELKAGELEMLSGQLKDILDFIDKLKKLDVKDISPTSHILPINNVLRDDTLKESLSCDKALQNAPLKQEKFFGVPKIIE